MNGYTGKILRVNLTSQKVSIIPTKNYEQWVGGHGMGSAIFWDLVKDKTIDGFNPANVITIMTSPLSGTLVPAASSRTEVQGIGVQSYPIGWFTRSNFGGRFGPMLKFAGWDGIVIEGKAPKPVWIDIRNQKIKIREAGSLWGLDTWKTQEKIWDRVVQGQKFGDWIELDSKDNQVRTTQRPAVMAIGPAGENLSRMACIIHDASNAAGQGGFGAVWGSKNLKAISVIGTGDIKVHDPKALMEARLWQKKNYAFDLNNLKKKYMTTDFQSPPVPGVLWGFPPGSWRPRSDQRPQACIGCHSGCRARFESGVGNEATCYTTVFYMGAKSADIQRQASDLLNKYGLNAHEMFHGLLYLTALNTLGILGPGRKIDTPLNFKEFGSLEFVEQFVKMVAFRNDGCGNKHPFGDDIAEGFVRAAKKWNRLEEDLQSGLLQFPFWGLPVHKEPTAQLEWGYGTILGDRDINEHGYDWIKVDLIIAKTYGIKPQATAEEVVKIYTDKMEPFQGDRLMLDFSTENMYSKHIAKLVSWHRYYTRFWKQSALFCDWRWPDFLNLQAADKIGSTGMAEPKFFKAVTGKNFSFLDGIKLGRKIWNLDHAVWTLQGRHRDMVHFANYIYNKPSSGVEGPILYLPGRKNGKWDYINVLGRFIDKKKFEEFKTRFYQLQGWDTTTGYPTASTLKSLGLAHVADELKTKGKLGKEKKIKTN
jgi:aldehyde:ferredoxin oxidoreductase